MLPLSPEAVECLVSWCQACGWSIGSYQGYWNSHREHHRGSYSRVDFLHRICSMYMLLLTLRGTLDNIWLCKIPSRGSVPAISHNFGTTLLPIVLTSSLDETTEFEHRSESASIQISFSSLSDRDLHWMYRTFCLMRARKLKKR